MSLKGTEEDEDKSNNALEKRGRSQKPMVLPEDVVEAEVEAEEVQVWNKSGEGRTTCQLQYSQGETTKICLCFKIQLYILIIKPVLY